MGLRDWNECQRLLKKEIPQGVSAGHCLKKAAEIAEGEKSANPKPQSRI